jgi:hypothetical protein
MRGHPYRATPGAARAPPHQIRRAQKAHPMNLAQYQTSILAKLNDVALAKFTADQIAEALRDALAEYSRMQPLARTYILETDGAATMALPASFAAIAITGINYEKDSTTYDHQSQAQFSAQEINEGWQVEVYDQHGEIIPAGQNISITYHSLHTVDNLDSASGTTVRAQHEQFLAMGAAGYALLSRANERTEAINLNPGVAASLRGAGMSFLMDFRNGIGRTSAPARTAPVYTEPTGF